MVKKFKRARVVKTRKKNKTIEKPVDFSAISPHPPSPSAPSDLNDHLDIPEYSSVRKIKTMTLQGGGVKGTGYAGVAEELEKTGVLAQLEEVAGSSAGSICAALIAIGYTAAELKVEMNNVNFQDFQDAGTPGWIESTHLEDVIDPVLAMAAPIKGKIALLNQLPGIKDIPIVQKIGDFIPAGVGQGMGMVAEGIRSIASPAAKVKAVYTALNYAEKGLRFSYDMGAYKGDALKNWLAEIVARKTGNPNITFKELAILAKDPTTRFKKLTVTGSNLTDERIEYFNATNTPDMSIIDAVRISSSFPGAFKPVIMEDKHGNKKTYVDGGLIENLPDMFNNPPYNPKENFAVVFKEDTDEPKAIKNPLDMAKALFRAPLSDKKFYEKYEGRIAIIDPVGMGTLEFDAPPEKKAAIMRSGQNAVKTAFSMLLKKEKADNTLFETNDITEIVKLKLALEREFEKNKNKPLEKRENLKKLEVIDNKIKVLNISPEMLKRLETAEKARLAIVEKRKDLHALTDDELMKMCKSNRDTLARTQNHLIENAKVLRTARVAIHMQKIDILRKFEAHKHKNPFYSLLKNLEAIEKTLPGLPDFPAGDKKAKVEAAQLVELERRNQKILQQRQEKVINDFIIKQNLATKDPALLEFLEGLKINNKKTGTTLPTSHNGLVNYFDRTLKKIDDSLEEVKIHSEQNKKEIHTFDEYEKNYSRRTEQAPTFTTLLKFKEDLDKSMYRNTRFLSRLKKTLLELAPGWGKTISFVIGAAGIAAFASCVCPPVVLIPLFMKGVIAGNTLLGISAVPFLGLPIAKAIEKLGPKSLKDSAIRFMNWFKWYDIDYNKKMLDFQEMTAELVRVMRNNYTKDKSEFSYLKRLYSELLKNSGLKLQDLLERKPNETILDYQDRIKKVEIHLKKVIEEPTHQVNINHADIAKERQAQAKFGEFQQKIYERNLKRMQKIELKIKSKMPLTKREAGDYKAFKAELALSQQLKARKVGKVIGKKTELWSHSHAKEKERGPQQMKNKNGKAAEPARTRAKFSFKKSKDE